MLTQEDAYYFWERRGKPLGDDLSDWFFRRGNNARHIFSARWARGYRKAGTVWMLSEISPGTSHDVQMNIGQLPHPVNRNGRVFSV